MDAELVGNAKTIKLLERIAASKRIANAYLFLGPQGVGKFEMALFFARKIIDNKEKIDSNLIIVEPEIEEKNGIVKKRDIKIEAIRQLQHKLSLTSVGGKYKAVIINEAERLNVTSQNALLKTLEEPNDRVVLILVSRDERKILSTIISRCQKIRLGLVSDSEIRRSIPDGAIDREEIVFWSAGRSEVAQLLLGDKQELEYMKQARRDFLDIANGGIKEKFSLAEKWSKDTSEMLKKMDIWTIFLRQAVLGKITAGKISPGKALEIIEEIAKDSESIRETNANTKLILENLFLKI